MFHGALPALAALALVCLPAAHAQNLGGIRDGLDQLVQADAQSWFFNRYDRGSVSNVRIEARSSDGKSADAYGDYTYNGGTRGWIKARIIDGEFNCVMFWDFPDTCRQVRGGASAGQSLAGLVTQYALAGNVPLPESTPQPASFREAIKKYAKDLHIANPSGWMVNLRVLSVADDVATVECLSDKTGPSVSGLVRPGDRTCRGTIDLASGLFTQEQKTGTPDGCTEWVRHTDRILGLDSPGPWKQSMEGRYCIRYYVEDAPSCARLSCGDWSTPGKALNGRVIAGRAEALRYAGY